MGKYLTINQITLTCFQEPVFIVHRTMNSAFDKVCKYLHSLSCIYCVEPVHWSRNRSKTNNQVFNYSILCLNLQVSSVQNFTALNKTALRVFTMYQSTE